MKEVLYHYDKIEIKCYCSLSKEQKGQLHLAHPAISIIPSISENRTTIELHDPTQTELANIYYLIENQYNLPYHIHHIEFAKDDVFDTEFEVIQSQKDFIASTCLRYPMKMKRKTKNGLKTVPSYKLIKGTADKRKGYITSKTLYLPPNNQLNSKKPRKKYKQLYCYGRLYKDKPVLRTEIRIVGHGLIKKISGIDSLKDLINYNIKGFHDSYSEKYLIQGSIDYDKIVNFLCPNGSQKQKAFLVRDYRLRYAHSLAYFRESFDKLLKGCGSNYTALHFIVKDAPTTRLSNKGGIPQKTEVLKYCDHCEKTIAGNTTESCEKDVESVKFTIEPCDTNLQRWTAKPTAGKVRHSPCVTTISTVVRTKCFRDPHRFIWYDQQSMSKGSAPGSVKPP